MNGMLRTIAENVSGHCMSIMLCNITYHQLHVEFSQYIQGVQCLQRLGYLVVQRMELDALQTYDIWNENW